MPTTRPPSTAWLFAKASLFTVLVPGSVVVLVPYLVLENPSLGAINVWGMSMLGLLPIVLGTALYMRCAFDFALSGRGTPAPVDPPVQLVASGPYRYSRNPMYIGILAILAGEAVLFRDRALLYLLLTMGVVFHLVVVLYEEHALRHRFGDRYARYREQAPRWIPRRSGLKELYRRSFLRVGAFVLMAGTVAHLLRLTVGLPVLEMPVSIHAFLVVLPAYAVIGCIIYWRRLRLAVLAPFLLLLTTVVMHVYSIAADTNEWYRIFPLWYSALAAPLYAGLALILGRQKLEDDPP